MNALDGFLYRLSISVREYGERHGRTWIIKLGYWIMKGVY